MAIIVDGKTYELPLQANRIAGLNAGQYMMALRVIKASPTDAQWLSIVERQRALIKGPGGLGVVPPNERLDRWDSIKDVLIPFGSIDGAEDSKSFGYWFNYFWNEAREAYDLDAAGKARLCDAFFETLESAGAGLYKATDTFKSYDYVKMQQILIKVMLVGFKRINIKGNPNSRVILAVDAKTLFATKMNVMGEKERTLPIGFRGDTRSPGDLAKTGFMARARCRGEMIHEKYGLNEPWHPFNLPIYADSLFVRKGKSKDNCLHTVISVATRLRDIMPYPLVSDASLYKLASKEPSTWTSDDVLYTEKHWLGLKIVRDQASGKVDRITSDKMIYVLDMSQGKGFDTELWQASLKVSNPFPERAIDGVLPEQLLGVIHLRKHYFYNRGEVSLFDIELVKFEFLRDVALIRAGLGDGAPVDIESLVKREIRAAQGEYRLAKSAYDNSKVVAKPSVASSAGAGLKCSECGQAFRGALLLKTHLFSAHGIES